MIGAFTNWIPKSDYQQWGNFLDNYNTYADLPRWVSVFTYTLISWKVLKKLKPFDNKSWQKQFVISFFVFEAIWSLHLLPYLIPATSNQLLDWVGWYPVYIPLTVMVYWLGLNGYLRIQPKTKPSIALEAELVSKVSTALKKAMYEDRMYLNPELTLNDVVKLTDTPQKTISTVLNQHLGKSFNEFVNEFRISEVKKRLIETGNNHLTITGIALECGFNSQATFQRAFRHFTGQSPREYQQTKLEIFKNSSQI
ncbi:MAG: AraC family transcriptional regulator [Bacteroidetes bacterium]|nr:AraC family transcriptional regulator [Bacteroidota bacterium]